MQALRIRMKTKCTVERWVGNSLIKRLILLF